MNRLYHLCVLGLILPLSAQTTKVIPPTAAHADMAAYVTFPFAVDTGRFQHLVAGDAITGGAAVLTQFSYRIDAVLGNAQAGRKLPALSVSIGYSSQTPATMSSTFAANIAGAQTLVFSGSYDLPTQPTLTGPGPWNLRFTWTRPFVYVRSKGNLLIETKMPGQMQQRYWYPLDGYAGGGWGKATPYGSKGSFALADQFEATGLATYLLHPGGRATIVVSDLKKNRPAIAVFGFSKTAWGGLQLPYSLSGLGAPGNWLHSSIDLSLPLVQRLDPKGLYAGSAWLDIPKITLPPSGVRLYAQAIFADATSNALGLVFSNGVDMLIDPQPGAPSNCMASASPTSATGSSAIRWGGPNGGPVIQLKGGGFN